ncbi:hypothetical protein A2875_00820 [Candidatus Gottesmanbacteria bacterium RIFCSPHIGHO2_01_FULL_46_14]|uniref:Uncharacterized protein n=3 Tax=Microgenomates group TaxID=1794810 RepID=A0A1F5ZRQ0_9BACT|nr:MAG: hypothetical protein UU34_C0016G0003 [Candidatus Curtissbacteria bacterium GW2011_GWA1_41_11]OGG15014.1 MAG: hypothetical protein A2875_00820 [Candidatus Gottesmanbacteria bacterium RIFCSPHIGHO2_01_FULL_46_14]OGG30258.1 MAG: hypothetical protein A2971_04755 [Candidatus Gottesmanbacteria bacterium RIFCSPLOWO2_01_FULL_46_21]
MSEVLPTALVPLGVWGLIRSVALSPAGGPYPRIGTYRGNFEIQIPHFFGWPATFETVGNIRSGVSVGNRVIVYSIGLSAEESDSRAQQR